jgi:molybdate transport system substrate-binding protein
VAIPESGSTTEEIDMARAVRRGLGAVAAVTVALGLTACSIGTPPNGTAPVPPQPELYVFASVSLVDAFTALATKFEADNPGVHVRLTFGADSRMAAGAVPVGTHSPEADVIAVVKDTSLVGIAVAAPPVTFAKDQFVVAVKAGNPKGLATLSDLGRKGLKVALCLPTEPCGVASRQLLKAAHVTVKSPIGIEDVRNGREVVERGVADAALVHRTDLRKSDTVAPLEFAAAGQAVVEYQALAMARAKNPDMAKAFIAYLASATGREALTSNGFQLP